jgi:hypothetical protein
MTTLGEQRVEIEFSHSSIMTTLSEHCLVAALLLRTKFCHAIVLDQYQVFDFYHTH